MSVMSLSVGSLFFSSWISQGESVSSIGGLSVLLMMVVLESGGWVVEEVGLVMDELSLSLVLLTIWVSLLVLMLGEEKENMYKFLFLWISLILSLCFMVGHVLWFYIFFELVLVPMMLVIVLYGNQIERLESSSYMIFYTVFGSLPLLVSVIKSGGLGESWMSMYLFLGKFQVSVFESLLVVLAFLIKLPSYGFHVWLPKAHVEAPVGGSMILAGVLLKLGGYGLLRLSPYLMSGNVSKGVLMSMGLWGGLLCSLICLRQSDAKKLIAYSSVVHMGLMLGGLLSGGLLGWSGVLMSSVAHGLSSSGLFYLVNIFYSRLHSRSLLVMKGGLGLVPGSMLWCFLLIASNSAAPPFLNIFSEVLLLMGILGVWKIWGCVLGALSFLSVGYGLYFYSVLGHGKVNYYVVKEVSVGEYLILSLHLVPLLLLISKLEIFGGS